MASQQQSPIKHALSQALTGGLAGSSAMVIQVVTLMWLRTTVNFQYRFGTPMKQAFKTLYNDGGIRRFYRGVGPALLQGPLSRFGDTAANQATLTFLNNNQSTKSWNTGLKTGFASVTAGLFRIFLMPIDTLKTCLQVEGKNGLNVIKQKLSTGGIKILYHGSIAASVATFVGHYPWFFMYNFLNANLPQYKDSKGKTLLRSAFIGFCSSVCSDTISNSFRVIKTVKQTSNTQDSYLEIARKIVEKGSVLDLLGRGLQTKIITNGIQGLMFSVLWKTFKDMYRQQPAKH